MPAITSVTFVLAVGMPYTQSAMPLLEHIYIGTARLVHKSSCPNIDVF